jgi:toxin ParE1/3/4
MLLDLSEQARRDIRNIHHASLTNFGAGQAAKYMTGLLDLLDLIAAKPQIARVRAEFDKPTRLHRYKSQVIFYRIEGESVRVVRILHGKQNWQEYL